MRASSAMGQTTTIAGRAAFVLARFWRAKRRAELLTRARAQVTRSFTSATAKTKRRPRCDWRLWLFALTLRARVQMIMKKFELLESIKKAGGNAPDASAGDATALSGATATSAAAATSTTSAAAATSTSATTSASSSENRENGANDASLPPEMLRRIFQQTSVFNDTTLRVSEERYFDQKGALNVDSLQDLLRDDSKRNAYVADFWRGEKKQVVKKPAVPREPREPRAPRAPVALRCVARSRLSSLTKKPCSAKSVRFACQPLCVIDFFFSSCCPSFSVDRH